MICLGCGIHLSLDAWDQYVSARTSYNVFQEPVTLEDLPVVTVCYEKRLFKSCDVPSEVTVTYETKHPSEENLSEVWRAEISNYSV